MDMFWALAFFAGYILGTLSAAVVAVKAMDKSYRSAERFIDSMNKLGYSEEEN